MKILWLTNNPSYAIEKLSPETQSGGWLKALNYHLVKSQNIELSVCFYWPVSLVPFEYHNTTYYPITKEKPKTLKDKVVNKISGYNNDALNIKKIKEVVSKVKPDVIHVHGTELNLGLIQFETSIPVVISIQGLLSPYYEKYFSGIPETYLKKIKKTGYIPYLKGLNDAFRLNSERERKILKATKYVMGRTDWDKRITRLLAPKSEYFIGNEILRESFYKPENRWSKTNFGTPLQLITTTGDVAYKGFELIAKTAKILSDYEIDIEWLVVGLNEKSILPQAVEQWLNFDYEALGIKFLGIKNESELIEHLLESDIYCQVSHIENSPNSLCEAMMIGMPIVATNVGGTSSMLQHDHEGVLVQEGEPYGLAGAIVMLSNDFEKAKTYGENAKSTAILRHDPSKVVNEISKAYVTILKKQ